MNIFKLLWAKARQAQRRRAAPAVKLQEMLGHIDARVSLFENAVNEHRKNGSQVAEAVAYGRILELQLMRTKLKE